MNHYKSTFLQELKGVPKVSIHVLIPFRVAGQLAPIPATVGQRRGTPWTVWCQKGFPSKSNEAEKTAVTA